MRSTYYGYDRGKLRVALMVDGPSVMQISSVGASARVKWPPYTRCKESTMKQDVRGEALAALEAAGCKCSYERAKLLVARLDGVSQLEMIDNVRSTRARLITKGVL